MTHTKLSGYLRSKEVGVKYEFPCQKIWGPAVSCCSALKAVAGIENAVPAYKLVTY